MHAAYGAIATIATTATIATIAAIAAALAALAALAANAANAASIAAASAALAALVAAVAAAADQLRRYAQYVPLCLGVWISRWRLLYGDPANMGYSKGSTSCGLRLDCSSCHQCPVRPRGQLDAASCLWCGRARRSDVPGCLRHVWCLRARLRAAALAALAALAATSVGHHRLGSL